jgi:glucokinase
MGGSEPGDPVTGNPVTGNPVVTDPAAAPVVTLDVGASWIKAALVAADGRRVAEVRRATGRDAGPDAVLARVCDVAAEVSGGEVSGAGARMRGGIAVCGAVGPGGRVTAVNLGWEAEAVGEAVASRIGIPFTVLNDAHAGAIGEGNFGAARGLDDYLYVSLGTGIGAAIVRHGRVVRGSHGHAGELGHISVDPRGPVCTCGARGCLQTFVSAAALETRWRQAHGTARSARVITDAVIAGEPAASALWESVVGALADGLVTAITLVDPAAIVLGGGLARAGDRLLSPLADAVDARSRSFHSGTRLLLASLGDWSGCLGAAVAASAAGPAGSPGRDGTGGPDGGGGSDGT